MAETKQAGTALKAAASQLFGKISVKDFEKPSSMVTCLNTDTISAAVKKLGTANILAMPVKDAKAQGKDWTSQYCGVIGMLDIVWFVLGIAKKTETWTRGFEQELEAAESMATTTVQQVLDSGEKTPFIPLSVTSSLLDVMVLLGKYKQHRAVIVDADSLVNIVTQSAMVRMIKSVIDKTPELAKLAKASLKDLGLATPKTVHTVSHQAKALTAFAVIRNQNVSAVPVLDKDGVIVGNVSARDIRSMSAKPAFIARMHDSLDKFLKEIQADKKEAKLEVLLKPVVAHPEDSFDSIIEKFVSHQIHRVYIVDEKRKPISVVTLTDVIATLAAEPSDSDKSS